MDAGCCACVCCVCLHAAHTSSLISISAPAALLNASSCSFSAFASADAAALELAPPPPSSPNHEGGWDSVHGRMGEEARGLLQFAKRLQEICRNILLISLIAAYFANSASNAGRRSSAASAAPASRQTFRHIFSSDTALLCSAPQLLHAARWSPSVSKGRPHLHRRSSRSSGNRSLLSKSALSFALFHLSPSVTGTRVKWHPAHLPACERSRACASWLLLAKTALSL